VGKLGGAMVNSITNPLFIRIEKMYRKFYARGFDAFNDYFPPIKDNADLFSERIKTLLLTGCCFSIIMMVISPVGFLYACFPRPFFFIFLYMLRIPNIPPEPTPEWGIHYITLLVYLTACYFAIEYLENIGFKPFQKIVYSVLLMIISFFIPFEFIYITLYDLFHNLPLMGYMAYWIGDFGRQSFWFALTHSVMVIDIVITVFCLIGLYLIIQDLKESNFFIRFKFDRISKILLLGFIISMVFWVSIPSFDSTIEEWGTKWFPQTIYVKFGYYEDYGIDISKLGGETFGIVEEFWYPHDIVKIANHISKIFSVAFMFYTFLPRKVVDIHAEKNKF
jgi:hypothetical protein